MDSCYGQGKGDLVSELGVGVGWSLACGIPRGKLDSRGRQGKGTYQVYRQNSSVGPDL